MKILFLHQHFATRSGAGSTRTYEFARRLVEQGHDVTMVAGRRQVSGTEDVPEQEIDGIHVLTLGTWYSNHLGALARIREFFRFSRAAGKLRIGPGQLRWKPDLVIASSTPLTIGLPGRKLARRFDVPFVFEVRDLWPQAPIEMGVLKDPVSPMLARRLERSIYRSADHIIALSPGMVDGVLAAGTPADKVSCIPNASDTDLFSPDNRDRTRLTEWGDPDTDFFAIHGGSMGRANGLRYVVDAAQILKERGEDNIRILLAGYGGTRPELEAHATLQGLDNIAWTGSIPREQLGPVVSSCDAALVSFLNLPVLATNSPNKMFDGLAAGLPCIVNSAGWTKDLVEARGAGSYVDPTDPTQLADELVRLRDTPDLRDKLGAAARQTAKERFDRELLAMDFESVLRAVATGETVPQVMHDTPDGAGAKR